MTVTSIARFPSPLPNH